jgi:uncharacterized protein (UPF0333 family)
MRFLHAAVVLSVLCAFAGMAATTATKSAATKKVNSTPAKSTTARSATSKKAATKKAVSSSAKRNTGNVKTASPRAKTAAKGKKAPVASWRTHQQNPTPDRYKEIQQALVDKGYLKSEPTGVWDSESIDAMQRFQTDQKMTPTGKINAPSLIGLGLGAKSAGAPEAPPLAPGAVPGAATPVSGSPPANPAPTSVPPPATTP